MQDVLFYIVTIILPLRYLCGRVMHLDYQDRFTKIKAKYFSVEDFTGLENC